MIFQTYDIYKYEKKGGFLFYKKRGIALACYPPFPFLNSKPFIRKLRARRHSKFYHNSVVEQVAIIILKPACALRFSSGPKVVTRESQ